jgi:hypothetical protein
MLTSLLNPEERMKRLISFFFVLSVLSSFTVPAIAQTETKENGLSYTSKICENFLQEIIAGNSEKAFSELFSIASGFGEESMKLVKTRTAELPAYYGELTGIEKVREEQYGQSVIRQVYLLKQEQHPTGWEFFFYKPENEWKLINIIFNDQLTIILEGRD